MTTQRTDKVTLMSTSTDEVLEELRALGVHLWEVDGKLRYRAPKGILSPERLALLKQNKDGLLDALRVEDRTPHATPDLEGRHEPFPLTPVQSAYLLGRRSVFAFGGVGCHGYGELEYPPLDHARLEAAWRQVVDRHGMLRAVIDADGSQRVQPSVPAVRIPLQDLRALDPAAAEAQVASTRQRMGHRSHELGTWPMFELVLSRLEHRDLLHFSIDFLIADFVSIEIILDDLERFYREPEAAAADNLTISYRDVQRAIRSIASGPTAEKDREYWLQSIENLPPAPDLPRASAPSPAEEVHFTRHLWRLEAPAWARFRELAAEHQISPSVAVLTAYAETISQWSRSPRFTLDLTLLNRPPVHPDVNKIVGDFTEIELLGVDMTGSTGFAERASVIQGDLWRDLDHRAFSGVDLIREVARQRGADAALFPVVFTSAIGLGPNDTTALPEREGVFVEGMSQTPQVWIDCQNIERQGCLETNWDVRDGVMPPQVVEAMFDAFSRLLDRLCHDEAAWREPVPELLPDEQAATRPARPEVVPVGGSPSDTNLIEAFLDHVSQQPDSPAIITPRCRLTYGELAGAAKSFAGELVRAGVAPGDRVGVVLDKSAEQVVAVLGILLAGATYVPTGSHHPLTRQQFVLDNAGASVVVVDPGMEREYPGRRCTSVDLDALATPIARPTLPLVTGDQVAYIIHTSGSTGTPKGVVITHASAWRTCADINRRFGVGPSDRVLSLTHLDFDLSVYDIFGLLGAGGALVLPAPERRADPSHWATLVADHGVTVWNSVPAQMQMLIDYADTVGDAALGSLGPVLLSGDWIPVNLPDRIRSHLPGGRIISLGGATEASIWSIFREVTENPVPSDWASIPYGRPLTDQGVHVLDDSGRMRPDWVPGEIYISGHGLAVGYVNDPALTAERFLTGRTGERLYRAGDYGRYLPDGDIEFLGRADGQVKIRGHRIEVAEVEAALASHPAVADAVVLAHGQHLERRLGAFVRAKADSAADGRKTLPLDEVDELADAIREGVPADEVADFARAMDTAALLSMLFTLQSRGLFSTTDERYPVDVVLERSGAPARYHRLVRRWLRGLTGASLLERDGSGHYRATGRVSGEQVDAAWAEVRERQSTLGYGAALLDYFEGAARRLPELLSGEQDPLRLLFPVGGTQVHDAAYRDNVLSRYLNAAAAGVVRIAAERVEPGRVLTVLTVGAGVSGAAEDLVDTLTGVPVSFHLTHVSPFFLNAMADSFSGNPDVTCELFDLNADPRGQGLLPNSFDVIVCLNAMHYATDVSTVLESFRTLLRPGGHLVVSEAVRDTYPVLISTEFILDGASTQFHDVRGGTDETFLTESQWVEALERAGGEVVLARPTPQDPYAAGGLAALVARFKSDLEVIDPEELLDHASTLVPSYMLPSSLQVLDSLPLSANGKVDRGRLAEWLDEDLADAGPIGGAEPSTDLEAQLAGVWAEGLRRENVGCDQDFFTLGGDSLLAARLAASILETLQEARGRTFDDLLRQLLSGATVAAMARTLEASTPDSPDNETTGLLAVVEVLRSGADTVRVILPSGTGTPDIAEELSGHLIADGDLVAITAPDPTALLKIPAADVGDVLAGGCVDLVRREGITRPRLLAFDTAGGLAVEVARRLVEHGVDVDAVELVAAVPPGTVLDENAVDLRFAEVHGVLEACVEPSPITPRATTDQVDGAVPSPQGPQAGWSAGTDLVSRIAQATKVTPEEVTQDLAVYRHLAALCERFDGAYVGDLVVVAPEGGLFTEVDASRAWQQVCLGHIREATVGGDAGATISTHALSTYLALVEQTAPADGSRP